MKRSSRLLLISAKTNPVTVYHSSNASDLESICECLLRETLFPFLSFINCRLDLCTWSQLLVENPSRAKLGRHLVSFYILMNRIGYPLGTYNYAHCHLLRRCEELKKNPAFAAVSLIINNENVSGFMHTCDVGPHSVDIMTSK